MPAIGSRDVAGVERPRVRHGEDAFQALDVGNGLLDVHDWPVYLRTLVASIKPSYCRETLGMVGSAGLEPATSCL